MSQRPFLTPGATPFRHEVERRSAAVLLFLRGLPRALPGLVVLGLAAGGLAAPRYPGAACLLVVGLGLVWLAYLSWPAVKAQGRAVRVGAAALVLAAAVARALDKL